ncbi:hypothetical protein predicted by Glimmer/Critica [Acetobacter senegalensis]|uniref:Uncharacterized protein n=1 Tax=Acetobacter senegalensis TaxID=446692 RepID=A0A0U5EVC6_9PROT|nr:hypothetical protein predicted by Glimmer/Critica [Acetobacter senegalensis]
MDEHEPDYRPGAPLSQGYSAPKADPEISGGSA